MADIRIDSSQLTFTQFLIPGSTSGVVDGAPSVLVSLAPGTYQFQQQSGVLADFDFRVTPSGTIDYDARHDAFLSGRGSTTLVVRGFPITLDLTPLSHDIVPTVFGATTLTRNRVHQLTLVPAPSHVFICASGVVADFTFAVAADGTVVVDPRLAGFADVSGRTLTIKGYRVTLDTRTLSHALVPMLLGFDRGALPPGLHDLTVMPSDTGYVFVSASGVVANFTLNVRADGTVIVDQTFAGFVDASGRTLTIKGYRITLDTRALSHALVPMLLGFDGGALPPGLHDLTVVPGHSGYAFVSASGVSANLTLDVKTDGTVVVEPTFAGFAEARGRTLIVKGYRITLDTRALSHALMPILLGFDGGALGSGLHDLTVVPGHTGYVFVSASGVAADFTLMIDADGTMVVDPRFTGFADVSDRTLRIAGYRVSLDTAELPHDVLPSLLGWERGFLSPGLHEFTAIPAAGYALLPPSPTLPTIHFNLDTGGRTTLLDAPAGVTAMGGTRRCGVPDSIATPLQIQTYGASGGRWTRGRLTVAIDPANLPVFAPPNSATQEIQNAFMAWQAVLPQFFAFTFLTGPADIVVAFGRSELDSRFGSPGGVAGSASYPEQGRVRLDRSEGWTPALLQAVVLHEIGHALGLRHSDNPASLMYPYASTLTVIDAESQDALRNMYGWQPQIPLADRATSDRPAMEVTTNASFTFFDQTLRMVWKGSRDDQSLYESALQNNAWTPQRLIPGVTSSHSPALASMPLNDGTLSTGLIMAWKGPDDNQSLSFATNRGSGWSAPQRIPDVGSSHRPALADFGVTHMAWKGVRDDQGIYWSKRNATGWDTQRNVRGVGTSDAPSLVVFQNRLFMFWKGVDGDSRVYYSSLDATPSAIWAAQRLVEYPDIQTNGTIMIPIGSSRGPSVTLAGNRLLLAWKGVEEDQGIYFSFFDGTAVTGQIRIADVGTSEGPSVCRIGGFVHMAWKGVEDDNRIYWSTLRI